MALKPKRQPKIIPTDPESIADEILLENDVMFRNGSFYLFDPESKAWQQVHDDQIKRLVLEELPGGYSPNKANAVLEVIRLKTARENASFAQNDNIIPFLNGCLDLSTLELSEPDKNDFLINVFPVKYNRVATSPRFIQFLNEIFENDPDKADKIKMLQEFTGLCLTKDISFQRALMLIGNGANGKSVFLSILENLFGGDNYSKLELHQLTSGFYVPELENKYLNICSEVNAKDRFSENVFKQIVSGEVIQADRKFKEPIKFKPFAKLVFAANDLPLTMDNSFAYFRRLLILQFNRTFAPKNQDRYLANKLIKELPGIVNWAIVGLERLHKNNVFTIPESSKEVLKQYKLASNNVLAFINDRCKVDANSFEIYKDFYQQYKTYCMDGGMKPKSQRNFKNEVLRCLPQIEFKRTRGKDKFYNIKLINDDEF